MACIIIGRFQPLHKGHVSLIKQALNNHDSVTVIVCNAKDPARNPFSTEERVRMIRENFGKNVKVMSVNDIGDDIEWYSLIRENAGVFDVVYSGNDWVRDIFESHGHTVLEPPAEFNCSATLVRKLMNEDGDWKSWLTPETVKVIEDIKGVERVKSIFKNQNQ